MKKFNLFILAVFAAHWLAAQPFTEAASTPFENVCCGSIVFAHLDPDPFQDVVVTGYTGGDLIGFTPFTGLYFGNGDGTFLELAFLDFAPIGDADIGIADIDGDSDLDILLTGNTTGFEPITQLWVNDGFGAFTEVVSTPLQDVKGGFIAFGDVDGDSDQDVIISGQLSSPTDQGAKLFLNDGTGIFTEVPNTPFIPSFATVNFADVDGDNDLDVLMTGFTTSPGFASLTKLYTNDGAGNFTEAISNPFTQVSSGSAAFGDVDADGDSDVLITGRTTSLVPSSKLYINDGAGNFAEAMGTPFVPVWISSVALADIDGDADLDVLISGRNAPFTPVSELYINDGAGNFSQVNPSPFEGVLSSAEAFGDVNGDPLPDVVISGVNDQFLSTTKLYINNAVISSTETPEGALSFTVFPNPASQDVLNVNCQTLMRGLVSLNVHAFDGRLLLQKNETAVSGLLPLSLDVSALPAGTYLLRVSNGAQNGVARFTVAP